MLDPHAVLAIAAVLALLWFLHHSGGRLAPRMAIAPLVFLVTRRPVLLAWGLGALGCLYLLIPGMQAKGLDSPENYAMALGLSLFCGGGVAVMVVGPLFFAARLFTPAPVLPLEDGEVLLLERLANHFIGGEARGGTLLVTSRRLAFRPHRFNVQLATWSAPLPDVERFELSGARLVQVHLRGAKEPAWLVIEQTARLTEYLERVMAAPEEDRAAVERVGV